jgi:hypothetical protein
MPMSSRAGALIAALAAGLCCPAASAQQAEKSLVRVVREASWGAYGLRAENAPLRSIGAALERAIGCRVEVDEKIGSRPFTLDLSPRPPERLMMVLARRARARLSISYRLRRRAPGEAPHAGSPAFASGPVTLRFPQPTPLPEVLRELPVPLKVEEGVDGKVRMMAAGHSLARVLDSLAAQVDGRWETVVALSAVTPVDAAAEADERQRAYFADLARLPPAERQEEMMADLEAVERLPPERRAEAVRQIAGDVLSLAAIYQNTPGEHREPVAPLIAGIVVDYHSVLATLRPGRRELFQPVAQALSQLQQHLIAIR